MRRFINIKNLEMYGYHGYYSEERKLGNAFSLNVRLGWTLDQAPARDELADTLNYELVLKVISDQMAISSQLLEHLASRISQEIMKLSDDIDYLFLSIDKLTVPVPYNLASIGVALEYAEADIAALRGKCG